MSFDRTVSRGEPGSRARSLRLALAMTDAPLTMAAGQSAAQPPACENVLISGTTSKHCGDTWCPPQYQGHDIVHLVVAPPA